MKKKIRCILIAIVFAIGILGSASHKNLILIPADTMTKSETTKQEAQVLAVDSLQAVDDFQIMSDMDGTGTNVSNVVRQTNIVFEALMIWILLFCVLTVWRRQHFGEKPIPVFRVVTFIHRLDGKKKSHFE